MKNSPKSVFRRDVPAHHLIAVVPKIVLGDCRPRSPSFENHDSYQHSQRTSRACSMNPSPQFLGIFLFISDLILPWYHSVLGFPGAGALWVELVAVGHAKQF